MADLRNLFLLNDDKILFTELILRPSLGFIGLKKGYNSGFIRKVLACTNLTELHLSLSRFFFITDFNSLVNE